MEAQHGLEEPTVGLRIFPRKLSQQWKVMLMVRGLLLQLDGAAVKVSISPPITASRGRRKGLIRMVHGMVLPYPVMVPSFMHRLMGLRLLLLAGSFLPQQQLF
jgi:hypothetical protein